jgi:tetratricopeptide (TPR) repeat protein
MKGKTYLLRRFWWLILLVVVVFLIILSVVLRSCYRHQANEKISRLLEQYSHAQCDQVAEIGSELRGWMRMGLNSNQQKQLDDAFAECSEINTARNLAAEKKYADASDAYSQYLADYPKSKLYPTIVKEAQNTFLHEAEEKGKNQDFKEAMTIYRDFLKTFPDSDYLDRARGDYLDTFRNWIDTRYEQKAYEEAMSVCKDWARKDIPETGDYCDETVPGILWDWGQQFEQEKDYSGALEKYRMLVDAYPDTVNGSKAKLHIPELYYEWGVELYSRNQKNDAFEKFIQALELVDTSDQVFTNILNHYPEAILAYAEWLRKQGRLFDAMFLLDSVMQADLGEEFASEVSAEYSRVIEQLARDTGSEGKRVFNAAISGYCASDPAIYPYPVLDIFPNQPGKAIFCSGGEGFYPTELEAVYPGEVRYYVKFYSQYTTLETCYYGDGSYLLSRVQISLSINIRFVRDLAFYSQNTFFGSDPKECPHRFAFYHKHEYLSGSDVDKFEIKEWLNLVIV